MCTSIAPFRTSCAEACDVSSVLLPSLSLDLWKCSVDLCFRNVIRICLEDVICFVDRIYLSLFCNLVFAKAVGFIYVVESRDEILFKGGGL